MFSRFIPVFLLFLFACSFSGKEQTGQPLYGGILRVNIRDDFRTLYPPNIVETLGKHIGENVYEGLVKCNPQTLRYEPSLAKSWEWIDSSRIFIFHLRNDVYFQNDPCFPNGEGRKMTAADVKFCFEKLCELSPDNQGYVNTFPGIVEGAPKSDNLNLPNPNGSTHVSGFKIINDSTLSIHLVQPCSKFISILTLPACWIYPKEAYLKYREDMRLHCVGTGPFFVKTIKENLEIWLQKNPKYWRKDKNGNSLPYLDNIKFSFIKDQRAELDAFKNREIDFIENPSPVPVKELMDDTAYYIEGKKTPCVLLHDTEFSVTYLGFQTLKSPFDNIKVRQAFYCAIDQKALVNSVLRGEGVAANHGFVPPGIPGYTNASPDLKYDPEKARKLLKEAGYPNGKKFPELHLDINITGNNRNSNVAATIQDMLRKNLNINVTADAVPFVQHIENVFAGRSLFWRFGWISDYPDPNAFLVLFSGKNASTDFSQICTLNSARFINKSFDTFFEKAEGEMNEAARMEDYRNAEAIVLNSAVVCPLYFPIITQLIHSNVMNYHLNGIDIRDLSEVWLDKGN